MVTFSPKLGLNTFYYLPNKRNTVWIILLRSATAFIFTQTLKNLNCPELWIPFVFSKRNSFRKAQKLVVTTKLSINVHFYSLEMKTYRFRLVKSQKLPCRNNYYSVAKISSKQSWPRTISIEVTYWLSPLSAVSMYLYSYEGYWKS